MVSACFEGAGFSLYGRDCIGCVPGGTLISKSMHRNPVWTRIYKIYIYMYISAYGVSLALRTSVALGSQPGASSAKSIRERPVFQRRNKIFALTLEPT